MCSINHQQNFKETIISPYIINEYVIIETLISVDAWLRYLSHVIICKSPVCIIGESKLSLYENPWDLYLWNSCKENTP